MTQTIIITPRLTLKPFTLDDAPGLVSLYSNPVTMQSLGGPSTRTLERTEAQIERWIQAAAAGTSLFLGIYEKTSGDLVGQTGFNDLKEQVGDIGIVVSSDHWGKGYGREAYLAVLRYGFDTLRLKSVLMGTDEKNEQMRHLAEKTLGLISRGPDPMEENSVQYNLTAENWPAVLERTARSQK
ncbi:hypothetical protein HKX48_003044 [Thoreauomyces humboldtii]|nr:hypothetical protein HKX48_003044 [Thoreauomyces humboldtii]